jgi:hypothetical protein
MGDTACGRSLSERQTTPLSPRPLNGVVGLAFLKEIGGMSSVAKENGYNLHFYELRPSLINNG